MKMTTGNLLGKNPEGKVIASFGEIMLRLSAPGFERLLQSPRFDATFGGGEANVLVSLSMQGLPTRFVTLLPDNDIGRGAIRVLRGYGVDVSHIIMKKNSRMGIYFIEKGANQRPSKVIYDRKDSAIGTIDSDAIPWEEALSGCGWFHITGITPALSQNAADQSKKAMETARRLGLIVSLDLNYRAKLWQYGASAQEVMRELVSYADVVIGNEEDCQKSLGIGADIDTKSGKIDENRYTELLCEVLSAYQNIRVLAVTLRESISASSNRWGACISDGETSHFSRKYEITHIVDRVGGGDSFAAGLIYGLLHFEPIEEALEYAAAASCLAHSIEGDMNLVTHDEIMNLYRGETSGRIKR
jgi:2-dehydro-3-deoxygluconokinase